MTIRFAPLTASPQRQRGAAAVLLLLFIGAGVALMAYNSDSTRMTADAAQLKRATDAAAAAVAQTYAQNRDTDIRALAERYVRANLGMDAVQTGNQLLVETSLEPSDRDQRIRVSATFQAESLLNLAGPADVRVSSVALARNDSLEVALALPNTLVENAANLAALRRLGRRFAEKLISGSSDNTWLALVPFSQAVNVYDPNQDRIRQWTQADALRPRELASLFRTGYAGLHDRRIPDRRANLLCLYRGLNRGENYFWDQPPSGAFRIYYRHDLPENGSPGAPPISWRGPNPDIWPDQTVDTRWMVADRGCPHAPLLPLTNDLDKIGERLDQMSTRFNVNYAIAMGWAAMALSPSFQGEAGWGLERDLPRPFKEDGGNSYKTIVMLVNSTSQAWFDSDSYNATVGRPIDGSNQTGANQNSLITQRFASLCTHFRERDLRVFVIVTGSDEGNNANGEDITSASIFRQVAGPGLARCAVKSEDITFLSGFDFVASESRIQERLDKIIDDIRQESTSVRLVE